MVSVPTVLESITIIDLTGVVGIGGVLEKFLHENRGFFPLRQEDCCAAREMDNSFSTGMEEIALLDREAL